MATQADHSIEYIQAEAEKKAKEQYSAQYVKDIAAYKEQLRSENDVAIQQAISEFKKSQEPPKPEEIQQLLSQEYLSFKVQIPDPKDETKEREFTIKELPQRAEKAFYKKFKDELIPRASDLGALTFEILGGDVGQKITSLLNTFEPTFDLLAEACVLILDPKKTGDVTKEWIQDNLSSYRQWNIIIAQTQVNRLRDFFSQLSRNSSGIPTNLGVGIRS